jgi:hypothetical protein
MGEVLFDDPAGRTRFAWARTLMVAFVASLLIERLFFAGSLLSAAILVGPVATIGVLTLLRSRPLRRDPQGLGSAVPVIASLSVVLIAIAALWGVAESL